VHDIPRKASGRIRLGAWESVHLFPDGGTTGTAAAHDFGCYGRISRNPGCLVAMLLEKRQSKTETVSLTPTTYSIQTRQQTRRKSIQRPGRQAGSYVASDLMATWTSRAAQLVLASSS